MSMKVQLRKAYRQVYRVVQVHGIIQTFRLATEKLRRYCENRASSAKAGPHAVSSFDEMWSVQTDGNEDLSELSVIDKTNYLLGNRYQPTAPAMFEQIVRAYPIDYEKNIFIDCGSGKGRVLLLASELPFRRIIGVEFASDLTEIAQANILAYRSPTQRCRQVEAVCMDATKFPFPIEPTVLYLANPFEGSVMRKFLVHVETSLNDHPRPFVVLYRNPKYANLWDDSKWFIKVAASEFFTIHITRDGRT